jgi:hypothetical protein
MSLFWTLYAIFYVTCGIYAGIRELNKTRKTNDVTIFDIIWITTASIIWPILWLIESPILSIRVMKKKNG